MPLRSLQSFNTENWADQPDEDRVEILALALEQYDRYSDPFTYCAAPITVTDTIHLDTVSRIVGMHNSQYRYYGQPDPPDFEPIEIPSELRGFRPIALRDAVRRIDPEGTDFLVPRPWETGICDGWLSITGPLLTDNLAFVRVNRQEGQPSIGRCHYHLILLEKDRLYRGQLREGWSVRYSHYENCAPVY